MKEQGFFSLEKLEIPGTEHFSRELLFLRIGQKLLYLYHSGLNSEEFLHNFQKELDSSGLCLKLSREKETHCCFQSLKSFFCCFGAETGSLEKQLSIAFYLLLSALEAEELLSEVEEHARYGDFEKIPTFSAEQILKSFPDFSLEFLFSHAELKSAMCSFCGLSEKWVSQRGEWEVLSREFMDTVSDRLRGKTFAVFENSSRESLSGGPLIAFTFRNVSPFEFLGLLSFCKEIAGIDYETLRLKRELLEISCSSVSRLCSRQRRLRFLKLFYLTADTLSLTEDFDQAVSHIINTCCEVLNFREFALIFNPALYQDLNYGCSSVPLKVAGECISWNMVKHNAHTLSSIIRDYTPFTEDEKQVLKRLYYYPLTLRGEIQGIAVFSSHMERLGFSPEEAELVKLILLLITQNILFNYQSEKLQSLGKLASLGQMAATIAHEIRNPLGGISLLGSFLEGRLKEESLKKMAADIRIAAAGVEQLISDFLSYSRTEKIKLSVAFLKQILEEVQSFFALKFQNQKIRLETRLAEIPAISLDREKIRQVIMNIMINALQETSENGLIRVETGIREEFEYFSVFNTGNRISEENMGKIFEPFFTTRTKGSGLGLAVCQKIVGLHNGKIEVFNHSDGVEFRVWLPVSEQKKN